MNEKFVALVIYVQPSFQGLKRRFPVYVNHNYKCGCFRLIERCKDVPKESRKVVFEYVHMGRRASTDEVLAEMDRNGLRPALYEELLGFARNYPEEQLKFPIVAFGSEMLVNGLRHVAYLWHDGDSRYLLCLDRLGHDWDVDYRFLVVRK